MTKPRNSILQLFDPLEAPCTPPRDSSPDSSSDKENDMPPPGDVTMFFNRTYAVQKHYVPKTPKGKLIDFGDTTMMDIDSEDEGDATALGASHEAEDDDTLDLKVVLSSPEAQRPPLADIDLESEQTSKARHIHRHTPKSVPSSKLRGDPISIPALTTAPAGSPLAGVINDILSSATLSESTGPLNELDFASLTLSESTGPLTSVNLDGVPSETDLGSSSLFPQISICSPHSQGIVSSSPASPVTSVFTDPRSPSLRKATLVSPTRRSPSAHALKANRTSIHLHESFNMLMQSQDMSFDLINDKISFISGVQDSFWTEDMNLAAEEAEMEEQARKCQGLEFSDSPDLDDAQAPMTTGCKVDDDGGDVAEHIRPVFSLPTREIAQVPANDSIPVIVQAVSVPNSPHEEVKTDSRPTDAVKADEIVPPVTKRRSSIMASVPPALRIVKKTFTMHGRTDSSTSAASSGSSKSSGSASNSSISTTATSARTGSSAAGSFSHRGVPRVSSVDDKAIHTSSSGVLHAKEAPPEPTTASHRTVIRGVQRPPPGAIVPGIHSTSSSLSGQAAAATRGAPARPATSKLQRPAPARTATDKPAQKATYSSGVALPSTGSFSKASAGGVFSGLRPPSRIATGTSTSALPVPASRLAQPIAGISRSNTMRSISGPARTTVKPGTTAAAPASRFGVKRP